MDVSIQWEDAIDNISHCLKSNLYIYFQMRPKKIYYIGMSYKQYIVERINQELYNSKWNENLRNQFGNTKKFHIHVGHVDAGRKEITENLIRDIEGLLIIDNNPEINIKSTRTHKLKTTKSLDIENSGNVVEKGILPRYSFSSLYTK